MQTRIARYFQTLSELPMAVTVTDTNGIEISTEQAWNMAGSQIRATHERGNKLMFVGNGGSAGIASHCAIDYCRHGGFRATAFNDGAALTCLGNDLGYEYVFSKQIEMHAQAGDLLIAISSSGQSPNIIRATDAARDARCAVYTFSGFSSDNKLRSFGDLNFYVPSDEYGLVEITHLALIHSFLDLEKGWGKKAQAKETAA